MDHTKVCTKCQEECPATTEFFHKKRDGKYGLAATCKTCSCKRVGQYNKENREKISKKNKKYREQNAEKIKQHQKKYRKNNKKLIAERGKKYRLNNRDKIHKQQDEWRKKNKEKIKDYKKEWLGKNSEYHQEYYQKYKKQIQDRQKTYREKNPGILKNNSAKRRALKLEQTSDYANLKLIKLIYNHCPKGYQVDHMKPIAKGGLHHESNLCYLPSKINKSKAAKTIEEFGEDVFNQHVIYWQDVLPLGS